VSITSVCCAAGAISPRVRASESYSRTMRRVLIALLCALLTLSGCDTRADDGPVLGTGRLTAATVPGPPVAFQVRLAGGQRLEPQPPSPNGCPGLRTYLASHQRYPVTFEAYATACELPHDNSRAGNGRHAWFRSAADVPAGGTRVETPLGEAVVFGAGYYECTNGCRNYTDTVAVITLRQPVDSGYVALVVRSDKGLVNATEMTILIRDRLATA
jgi:hypothetical protein